MTQTETQHTAFVLVHGKRTPYPYLTFQLGLPAVDAHERVPRKVYVRASGTIAPLYDRNAEERRSRPGWKVYELPLGQKLMINAPRELTEILLATLD